MRILKSKAVIFGGLLAVLSQLAPGTSASARDVEPVVEMGALAHAAGALEDSTGGKVLEIRLADETGVAAFEAAVSKGDAVVYLRIAAVSDDVTEIKVSELPPWLLNYKLEAYMRSIEKAQVPLGDAIMKAEVHAAAPAIGAGLAKPLSGTTAVLAYFVETINGGKRELLAVDARSGVFIANPDALYEPYTPVKLARRLAQ